MLSEDQKRKASARSRAWYLANKDLVNERARKSRAKNPEHSRKVANAYYRANKEHKVRLAKAWIAKNKDKVLGYTRKHRYGVTLLQINEMFAAQQGLCAICTAQLNPLNLDHDHVTNKVRSLLCSRCNQGLGQFKDSIELLRKAADYVERHQTN